MVDLTHAAKPKCLTMEGYEERYAHIQQFGTRPSGHLGAIKEALMQDIRIVTNEPTISAVEAINLRSFLETKLNLVKSWDYARPGRNPHD